MLLTFFRDGARFMLPSELEWEKAARGGGESIFPWGDDAVRLPQLANVYKGGVGNTAVVGSFTANHYGLHDMIGNVWEWTRSLYDVYPYCANDGREVEKSDGPRVLRGGSWYDNRDFCRCAYRLWDVPGSRLNGIGFRVCVGPPIS